MFGSKTSVTFLFLLVLLTGCYTSLNVVSETHSYNKNVSFTIEKVEEGKQIDTGNGYLTAAKGLKFVFLYVSFKNTADVRQQLDFGEFFLLDIKTHMKYKVELSMLESVINLSGSLTPKIQKNDTRNRKLVFTFPEKEHAAMLMVNNEIYSIQYTDTKN